MKKWVPAAHYRLLGLSLAFGIAVSFIPHWISIVAAIRWVILDCRLCGARRGSALADAAVVGPMKLFNRYALLGCFLGALVVVILARLQTQIELAKAIIGALYLLVPIVVANIIATKIGGDPLDPGIHR